MEAVHAFVAHELARLTETDRRRPAGATTPRRGIRRLGKRAT